MFYLDLVSRNLSSEVAPDKEIGIEIECEGKSLPDNIMSYWTTHNDGSLRPPPGYQGIEYVFKKPLGRKHSFLALDYLEKKFAESKSKFIDSPRTSVHVHLNYFDKTYLQAFNMIVLYYIFEEILVEYSGSHRIGNLFCLRGKDAEGVPFALAQAMRHEDVMSLAGDSIRYAALNISALFKYGSLEFRSFRGTTSAKEISKWVHILLALKDKAAGYTSPDDVIMDFSMLGPREFFLNTFAKDGIFEEFATIPSKETKMYGGARLIQDFAFSRPWKEEIAAYNKNPKKADPKEIPGGRVTLARRRPPVARPTLDQPLELGDEEPRRGVIDPINEAFSQNFTARQHQIEEAQREFNAGRTEGLAQWVQRRERFPVPPAPANPVMDEREHDALVQAFARGGLTTGPADTFGQNITVRAGAGTWRNAEGIALQIADPTLARLTREELTRQDLHAWNLGDTAEGDDA